MRVSGHHRRRGGRRLVLVGLALILARNRLKAPLVAAVLVLVMLAYAAGAIAVATVGGTGEDTIQGTANALIHFP